MVKLKTLAVLALGILIGAIGSALWIGSDLETPTPRLAVADLSKSSPASTYDLGRLMMARIAKSFVADSRPHYPLSDGVTFISAPMPYGDILCSVDAYRFQPKIVRGSPIELPQYWSRGLEVSRQYGILPDAEMETTGGKQNGLSCLGYKDFAHLVRGADGTVVERAVRLFAKAKREELKGSATFKVSCVDLRPEPENPPKGCDGRTLLKDAQVKQIDRVSLQQESEDRTGADHVDVVDMAPTPGRCGGGAETLTFRIASRQLFGRQSIDEGDIRAVEIQRGLIC